MLFSSLSRAASMTINPALTTLLFLFRSLGRPRRNRRAKSSKSFHSFHEVSTLIVCKAMRMHGHVSQIDKCCPPEWITATQVPYTYLPSPAQIYLLFPVFPSPMSNCNFHAHKLRLSQSSCHVTLRPPVAHPLLSTRRQCLLSSFLNSIKPDVTELPRNWRP